MRTLFKILLILSKRQQSKGFTLVELLVILIIIGILSAIAVPAFIGLADRGRLSEAREYLGSLSRAQQSYYVENGVYATGDPTDQNIPANSLDPDFQRVLNQLGTSIPIETDNYVYGYVAGVDGFTFTADPVGGWVGVASKIFLSGVAPIYKVCLGEGGEVPDMDAVDDTQQCPAVN